ncbi:hypothetical protein DH2020_002507 [Rehmannia glutinosa]|uniref:Hyaluronan/mRNA-binding protein domain-containing protein n=1 Tax=Rehmannia glutinosa TaxID=99300 RepID=A0ABR0XTW9_REHGL
MATINPFDLLGDTDTEDPSVLIAAQPQKVEPKKTPAPSAKPAAAAKGLSSQNKATPQPRLPSKPLPPSEAGASDEVDAGKSSERRGGYGGPRGPFRGGRRGGFSNGEVGEGERDRPRRPFDRRSGTGRMRSNGKELGGELGTQTDELAQVTEEAVNEGEKTLDVEKPSGEEDAAADGDKEAAANEVEEKEPEDKEMTLEEYEKVLEEKRKALLALKTEERKVDAKEFESMQPLSNKKANDDIFIKLSVSINEFLKPAEGERYYNPGGRGRGRGRGSRGGYNGGSEFSNARAPAIEDPGQFPTLGGK